MKQNTLQVVPTAKIKRWLAVAEKEFGSQCTTAKTLRAELVRREVAKAETGVNHVD